MRLAKKTNYLTELIERHERWRAEGGEKIEQEELNAEDLYVIRVLHGPKFIVNSVPDLRQQTQRTYGTLAQSAMSGVLGR